MVNRFKAWQNAVLIIAFGGVFSTAYVMDVNSEQKVIDDSFYFLKRGMSAYKNGQINQALSALRCAADMGNIDARWKLGSIYAEGDGVPKNDYKAYNFFASIVEKAVDLDSEDASYVSDALVRLAGYIKKGIPQSPVKPNPSYAARLYMQAAMNYGNSKAQYHLGKIFLRGEGREKNLLQAARWFQLSARKGNPPAQAMLGNMLIAEGKIARGTAMLTVAYQKANVKDRDWIRPLKEHAIALCDEFEKRKAFSLVGDILKNNHF
ncbi:tetratricopeptide repeat protein [Bartonella vinsonii]|uniref:Exopolysacchride production negative regulator ExoR n=1 Tax=Bartonella vinsonii subsp. berkhoffii str. Tweed TaxID=1094502 RepID=N6VPC2_BARVB|nr:tetratricopeptide repeat protein [Bartonella vinsonii]AGF76041.1 exopolysacchride production negative regulator ExoR [Bartonella vinsonii subsp. berkhoffii str. Winnie]ENN95011.1 exopolysacchride production negative regulator ExoR [Bartonella vinsonii subsp. berkhoffii str. Tweed]